MTDLPRCDKLLVLGGTGFVGRAVVARWVERHGAGGSDVTVATRRLAHGRALRSLPTVDLAEADVHDDAALASLVAGRDAVVNLVAVLHGDERRFQQAHVELPRRLAAACRQAGVQRVVHVSALGVAADAPSRYLRSKMAGELVLQQAGLALTVLRPSVVFGAEDRFMNMFAALQSVFPLMPLAACDARFQPVWVQDLAEAVVRCLERPQTAGLTIECAGPAIFTLRELVQRAGTWSGHRRTVLPLPDALGRLQARLMELAPGDPLMSRDNLDSMRVPNVSTGTLPGLTELGIVPTALEAVAPGYLGGQQGAARLERWRAGRA